MMWGCGWPKGHHRCLRYHCGRSEPCDGYAGDPTPTNFSRRLAVADSAARTPLQGGNLDLIECREAAAQFANDPTSAACHGDVSLEINAPEHAEGGEA